LLDCRISPIEEGKGSGRTNKGSESIKIESEEAKGKSPDSSLLRRFIMKGDKQNRLGKKGDLRLHLTSNKTKKEGGRIL